MDFSAGYSSNFHFYRLDTETWEDAEELIGVLDFSASKSIDGEAPEIDSADIDLLDKDISECYIRVWLSAKQGGEVSYVALGTYLLEAVADSTNRITKCNLWSVLHPAVEKKLPVGYYVPSGSDCAQVAAELLRECLNAPVGCEGNGPALTKNLVANGGDSYLDLAWALLGDDFEIVTDCYGAVLVRSREREVKPIDPQFVIGEISKSWNLADVPNAIRISDGVQTVEVLNEDPYSPTSIPSRGRRIDGEDSSDVERQDGETLEAFANRLLREQSVVTETAEYEREFIEGLGVGDLVKLPNESGVWRVITQTISIGCGVTVSETVSREVQTYEEL